MRRARALIRQMRLTRRSPHLPPLLKSVLSFGVATGGITAMILNLVLPRRAQPAGANA